MLRVVQPQRESLGPPWLVPGIEIALLLALLAANPAQLSRRRRWLRPLAIVLLIALMAVTLLATAVLITELVGEGR